MSAVGDRAVREDEAMEQIRAAFREHDVRFVLTWGFNFTTGKTMKGVRIEAKEPGDRKRWKDVGPTIYPAGDQTLGDVLKVLGDLYVEERS